MAEKMDFKDCSKEPLCLSGKDITKGFGYGDRKTATVDLHSV